MTSFISWTASHPQTGESVEVVPRALLEELAERRASASSAEELEQVRERAAAAVVRACERLELGDEVDRTLAATLSMTMLNLIDLATRA